MEKGVSAENDEHLARVGEDAHVCVAHGDFGEGDW